ncbi:putative protease [Lachnospiraceae bacterium KH1T2]|nr:putative protease [Lachnospiraceae bacterium KH1T2]
MNINVLCERPDQAAKLAQFEAVNAVYSKDRPKGCSKKWIQVMPYVMRDEPKAEKVHIAKGANGVLVRNYEEMGFVKESEFRGDVIADASLYSFNSEAAEALKEAGITKETLPLELNVHEMRKRGTLGTELVIYGRTPLMITANCLYLTEHHKCGRNIPEGYSLMLTDRKNVKFPTVCECRYCYNVIYNSVPVSLHKEIEVIESLGVDSVRLNFTTETPEEAKMITEYFVDLFNGVDDEPPFKDYTRGHFRKGVE